MFVPATLEDRHQGENDEREGDKGEQNMAGQHWKIDRRQPAAKAGVFFANVDVISDVADEKKGGGNDRRDHADDVALPKIALTKLSVALIAGKSEMEITLKR